MEKQKVTFNATGIMPEDYELLYTKIVNLLEESEDTMEFQVRRSGLLKKATYMGLRMYHAELQKMPIVLGDEIKNVPENKKERLKELLDL